MNKGCVAMIFASDLDRTLIFSNRFRETAPEDSIELVEVNKGREISYVSDQSVSILKKLSSTLEFIPVTTRTKEEYARISFIGEIQPTYAIVANGGKILINGQEDQDWNAHVSTTLDNMELGHEEVKQTLFSFFPEETFSHYKLADGLFWMFRVKDEHLDSTLLLKAQSHFEGIGWTLTQTGVKLYLLPAALTKWKALSYLKEKIGSDTVVAAGDSLMDYEMLCEATVGVTPRHGEINLSGLATEPLVLTQTSGIPSGLEILHIVTELNKIY